MITQESFLRDKARWVRQTVLSMAVKAKSGHVTTAFSQTEVLTALYYGGILRFDSLNPNWEGRDRFVLSKGQGGIGLYPILADLGFFPLDTLEHFAEENNILGVHAEWNIPGIEVITGSLGHGLPLAVGMAHAARLDKKSHLVFCMLGDAELHEGSNWEAAMVAGHMGYGNLVCIVDRNGQGVLGFTDRNETKKDGPSLNPLDKKFEAFGFEVREVDGHSYAELFSALSDIRQRPEKPLMVIAQTEKGHGSQTMVNQRLWHYRVPNADELRQVEEDLKQ